MKRLLPLILSCLLPFQVFGASETNDPDPWESFNRSVFSFNEWVDHYFAKPVAEGYREVMPVMANKGVTNFFRNLGELENTFNNVLQLKFEGAGVSLGRFTINSTIGWFGLVDVATHAGIYEKDEDFGQTLGYWGVPNGPYVMLPLLGPSTVRDTAGRVGDMYTPSPLDFEPMSEEIHRDTRLGLTVLKAVDKRADIIAAENVVFGDDKYAFLRDAYLQTREFRVNDGAVADPFSESMNDFDDLPE